MARRTDWLGVLQLAFKGSVACVLFHGLGQSESAGSSSSRPRAEPVDEASAAAFRFSMESLVAPCAYQVSTRIWRCAREDLDRVPGGGWVRDCIAEVERTGTSSCDSATALEKLAAASPDSAPVETVKSTSSLFVAHSRTRMYTRDDRSGDEMVCTPGVEVHANARKRVFVVTGELQSKTVSTPFELFSPLPIGLSSTQMTDHELVRLVGADGRLSIGFSECTWPRDALPDHGYFVTYANDQVGAPVFAYSRWSSATGGSCGWYSIRPTTGGHVAIRSSSLLWDSDAIVIRRYEVPDFAWISVSEVESLSPRCDDADAEVTDARTQGVQIYKRRKSVPPDLGRVLDQACGRKK